MTEAEMRLEIARLQSENREATRIIGQQIQQTMTLNAHVERLQRLAFGAGMALVGVVPDSEHGADFATAQDLIAQMLEEPS